MAHYEAVVTGLLPDGKAEIVIQPDKPGIPDAAEISERVCHCATENSMVRTMALNRAGAMVGDLVAVQRDSSVVLKNLLFLIGFPLGGALAGMFVGGLAGSIVPIGILAGALSGIILGVKCYRRLSEENLLVIDHILKTRDEFITFMADQAVSEGKDSGCQAGCKTCMPWLS